MINLVIIIGILTGSTAFAASGPVEIPVNTIMWQVFNVVVAMGIIRFFLKNVLKIRIRESFKTRRESFTQLMNKAEAAKKEAEATHKKLKEKLTALKSEAADNSEKARREASEFKAKLLADAKESSGRLINEAQLTSSFELEKSKLNLRVHLLDNSVSKAQSSIKDRVSEEELNKLQQGFADKIQVVQ